MKKLILIFALVLSLNAMSQCAGNNSLQMQVRHWFWVVNKFGPGTDSVSIAQMRGLRTQMIAANPADSTTLVTINNIPNEIILGIYHHYIRAKVGDYLLMGTTDAERRTIFTNIRAIATPCVVAGVAALDYSNSLEYWLGNKNGKAILKDTQ